MGAIRMLVATILGLAVGQQALVASAAPANWACDELTYGDGVCDCGCGAADSDCGPGRFTVCERSGCLGSTVPWEHSPSQCMRSACGDGWRDEAAGEVCDDAEALASGGCSADCSAVNAGWTCGGLAAQCEREVVDADQGVVTADMGVPDASPVSDAGLEPDAAAVDLAVDQAVAPTPDQSLGQPAADGGAIEADQGDQNSRPSGDQKSSDGGCSAAATSTPPAYSLLAFALGLLGLLGRRRRA
jgi:MYXO-CTERM domain-containing protein